MLRTWQWKVTLPTDVTSTWWGVYYVIYCNVALMEWQEGNTNWNMQLDAEHSSPASFFSGMLLRSDSPVSLSASQVRCYLISRLQTARRGLWARWAVLACVRTGIIGAYMCWNIEEPLQVMFKVGIFPLFFLCCTLKTFGFHIKRRTRGTYSRYIR